MSVKTESELQKPSSPEGPNLVVADLIVVSQKAGDGTCGNA